jgi:hypothetical protein
MKKILILLVIIYSFNQNFAQVRTSNDVFLFPQGNPIGELNGIGTSGLSNMISNIGSINPAALNNFEKISFGFSYQFETKIDEAWIADIGYKRNKIFLPQSIGFQYPFKNFRLGISFRQGYNGIMDLGQIPVTTNQYPDGTGEFINFQDKIILNDYSIIASYSFKKVIDTWNLSIGGRFNIKNMTEDSNGFTDISLNYKGNSWAAGIMFEKRFEANKYMQYGLSYEKDISLTGHPDGGLNATSTPNIDSTRLTYYTVINTYKAQFPARVKFDFDISLIRSIKFLGSISNVFWKNIDSSNPNAFEYAGSVVYAFNNILSSSLGIFSTRKEYYSIDKYFNTNENLQAFFLILGSSLKIDNIQLDFSLADSHAFSGNWRKQTTGKLGIGYEF